MYWKRSFFLLSRLVLSKYSLNREGLMKAVCSYLFYVLSCRIFSFLTRHFNCESIVLDSKSTDLKKPFIFEPIVLASVPLKNT